MWGSGAVCPWRPTAVPSAEKYGGCKDMTALWGPDYAGQDVMTRGVRPVSPRTLCRSHLRFHCPSASLQVSTGYCYMSCRRGAWSVTTLVRLLTLRGKRGSEHRNFVAVTKKHAVNVVRASCL